ncbi:MAG: diguanylate cyclase, partial [Armatimonadota bacterium]|nr:diguanylate cyclase [Armatimonadota bacterium]
MTAALHFQRVALLKRGASVAAALVIVIPLLVLVGWTLHNEALKRILPGLVAMNPVTALCLILSGISLGLLKVEQEANQARRRAGWACAGIVAVISLLVLARDGFGLSLFPDRLLFFAQLAGNTMAPTTAASFLLASLALLLLPVDARGKRPSEYFALAAVAIALLALIGYAYN